MNTMRLRYPDRPTWVGRKWYLSINIPPYHALLTKLIGGNILETHE